MSKKFSFADRLKSFVFAFRGLALFFRTQHNGWIHLLAALVVTGLGFWLKISATDWVLLAICIGVVISAEIFNTAIEFLVDKISPGFDQQAGRIKDLAAAGVLVAALAALVSGIIIFTRYLY